MELSLRGRGIFLQNLRRLNLELFKKALKSGTSKDALELCLFAHEILSEKNTTVLKTLKRLDFLFHEFSAYVSEYEDSLEGISALNSFLFNTKGFKCSPGAIHDNDKIFISKVIECRHGHPLSLSLIYRELARRIHKSPVELVNFPGHFFIKFNYQHQLRFLDPSDCGRLLSVSDLQKKLTSRFGKAVVLSGTFLETPSETQIVVKFLNKLKAVYFERRQWDFLLVTLDMLVALEPERVVEYKERGLLLYQLGYLNEAYPDLDFFVSKSRPSPEIDKLKSLMTHLRHPDISPLF